MSKATKIIIALLVLSLLIPFFNGIGLVLAEKDSMSITEVSVEMLMQRESLWETYEEQVISLYTDKTTMTDSGIRRTVVWNLNENEGEDTLVFVFNEDGEPLYTARIFYGKDTVIEQDYLSKEWRTFNTTTSYFPTCYTDECVSTRTDWSAVRNCNLIVGSSCRTLSVAPIKY